MPRAWNGGRCIAPSVSVVRRSTIKSEQLHVSLTVTGTGKTAYQVSTTRAAFGLFEELV